MRCVQPTFRSLFFPLAFAGALTFVSSSPGWADTVGTIVPAYFYPGTGGPGGVGDGWAAMTAAASKIPLTAIFNPDSGPGPSEDPNYAAAISNLESAGGHVVAYIYTDDGNAPLATVEGEANTYITQYGGLIEGFYLDGMFVLPSTLSYYQTLDTYIKGLKSSYTVVGNPGQPFLNGVSATDYLSTANILDIFEGPNTAPAPGSPGFNNYPYGLNWFEGYSNSHFDNTVFDASSTSAMLADIHKAIQLNAGYVYVTDQNSPNPYGQLPSYWNQEVAAIAAVPEPATGALTLFGGLLLVTFAVRRRPKPERS
jgi:hypothetical protein